ncbi:copper amine oxidase N-terminal domain-containing protein [Paenibacillus sp. LHD-117]|uniref:copper amine oxidase N-terminal domain-containing protein n=1 Tax=Paenibacillus sp. LHD-117 TaxID=3071412 RepID=UPI0027E05F9A|nr:copper amine oxidase N-terminal domain-containing protein [Paenibacillus sp. LHD-117]MDQ6423250.1 copper amine oxidase N-terminal domain-containing protein [Paenibacillus sp. LHD-117]
MKRRLKQKIALALLFVFAVMGVSQCPGMANASPEPKPVTVSLNTWEETFQNQPFLQDGSAYLPLREMGRLLNGKTTWIAEERRIVMSHPDVAVELTLGSKEAEINGEKVVMRTAPINKNGVVYVPVRFVTQAFGGKVAWDEKKRHVALTREEPYMFLDYAGIGFWLAREDGELHAAKGAEPSRLVADTNVAIKGYGQLEIATLSDQTFVLKAYDNYGEPANNSLIYKLVVSGGKLTLESKAYYYGHPVRGIDWSSAMHALLVNGSTLYEVNHEGAIVATHDLQALTGYEDENFHVEWYDDEFMVVRPDRTGWLTLVNQKTKETVNLTETLLSKAQWDIYQSLDKLSPEFANWDGLNVVTREGNRLQLNHYYFIDSKDTKYIYDLK